MSQAGPPGQPAAAGNQPPAAGTPERGRSAAEWTSLAVSAVIVVGLVVLLTYQHVAGGARPPSIEARPRLDALRRESGAYYLPVEITNRGDVTAGDVRVRVTLVSGSGQQEAAELDVQFLAGGATSRSTAVFRDDPSRGRLTADVLSLRQL